VRPHVKTEATEGRMPTCRAQKRRAQKHCWTCFRV